ncbi:prephenate dehydratase [bacterium]|nr:prephenate dehydratase [bacterium]
MSGSDKTDSKPLTVSGIRAGIDSLDEQIQTLITERAEACAQIARLKHQQPDAISSSEDQLASDAQILRKIAERNSGPVDDHSLQRIFREIICASGALEEPVQVAYLGPEGTYSHTAADTYFGHGVRTRPEAGIAEIFDAVEAERAKFGVVPVENSTEGAVNQTLDLLTQTTLRVCGEVRMRIQHCLLSNAESLSAIKEVHAHPQALAQCKRWLADNLAGAVRVSESSNAAAARLAIERADIAAIAGETAAELYALNTLEKGIEDEKNNTTRFLVIGNRSIAPSGDDSSLLLVSAPHRPGGLRSMLAPLEEAAVNITRIESRPSRSALWEYVFFINVDGHEHDDKLSIVLTQLREFVPLVKVLGSYPRAL